jgi:release factor glutamine methyltransferase
VAQSHKVKGSGVTVRDALVAAAHRLAIAGCETPQVDAELLVAQVLASSRSEIRVELGRELGPAELAQLEGFVSRREQREPLAYVLGEWGFRRLTLGVDPRVLVPRPETEVVVERCLAQIGGISQPRVLDVGTGSGAIALAIADEHRGARVTGIDASEDALAVARENASRARLGAEFVCADLFDGLPEGPWDLVVSNPPYVRPSEIESLASEVRDWEPRDALVGEGASEAVAAGAVRVLRSGGALVLETADGDAGRIAAFLRELGYGDVVTTKDLTGRERVVEGVWS